jgi:hypothetical protein
MGLHSIMNQEWFFVEINILFTFFLCAVL